MRLRNSYVLMTISWNVCCQYSPLAYFDIHSVQTVFYLASEHQQLPCSMDHRDWAPKNKHAKFSKIQVDNKSVIFPGMG